MKNSNTLWLLVKGFLLRLLSIKHKSNQEHQENKDSPPEQVEDFGRWCYEQYNSPSQPELQGKFLFIGNDMYQLPDDFTVEEFIKTQQDLD